MKLQNFTLNDGAKLSVIPHEKGIYLLLDGQPLAGPFDPKLARFRVTVKLPPGRGKVGVHLNHNERYEVIHDGREVYRSGTVAPSNALLKRPRRLLVGLGILNYLLFFALERWAPASVETWPVLLSAAILLSLALWAYLRPQDAWMSLGVAIALIALSALVNILSGARIGSAILPAVYTAILWTGFRAAWADRTQRVQLRNSYRQPLAP